MTLGLSSDEALILFDFLSRWEATERFEIADQAEERVLWKLLDEARARVRDGATKTARRMSMPAKLAVIALTLLPLVYLGAFMAMIGSAFSSRQPPPFVAHFGTFMAVHLSMMLLMFALLAFYVVFIFRTTRIRGEMKAVWAIAMFMAGPIAMPVFWYLYIWRD